MDREQLRQLLNQHFNNNELSGLCFRLNIDNEIIPGQNKDEKIRELIAFCERNGRVPDLLAACRQLRPTVDWPDDPSKSIPGQPTLRQEVEDRQPGSWQPMLLINLVFFAIFTYLIRIPTQPLCVSPSASSPSLALIVVLVFHLLWRYLGPIIIGTGRDGGVLNLGPVAFPIRLFALIIDAAHPWKLSDRVLWLVAIVIILGTGVLGLSPLSPFQPLEATPIIQSFSARYLPSGPTETPKPGDALVVKRNQQVLVEAEILDQADALCTWNTINGALQTRDGCSTLYNLSFAGERDSLDVLVFSPCKTQKASASLHIEVSGP